MSAQRTSMLDKLRTKIQIGPECWQWTGALSSCGYGRIGNQYAHRIMYSALEGEIPAGMEIDHLCRNRGCVKPSHLEAVAHSTNVRRGIAPALAAARGLATTHCPQGHPLSGDNIYWNKKKGWRSCRICGKTSSRERQRLARLVDYLASSLRERALEACRMSCVNNAHSRGCIEASKSLALCHGDGSVEIQEG
jgi:hypothetical protein